MDPGCCMGAALLGGGAFASAEENGGIKGGQCPMSNVGTLNPKGGIENRTADITLDLGHSNRLGRQI
jgi:hypothetical protein